MNRYEMTAASRRWMAVGLGLAGAAGLAVVEFRRRRTATTTEAPTADPTA